MARPPRVEFPGALYHVIVRGNERRDVFRDDGDRERYLERLAHYREKFQFRLLAYCLMDNHVHLALETGRHPLSRVMAGLQTSYTQYFNRRHDRVGHLFQGRYKAFVVEEDRYGLALLRYIHENPVRARIVGKPEEYKWSSDDAYRQGRGPEWLDVDAFLTMLGRRRSAAVRGYRRLMREELEEPYEEVASWGQTVVGDEAFADRVLAKVGESCPVRRGLDVDDVADKVASRTGLVLAKIRSAGRGEEVSRARLLTAWIGREVGAISIARTAHYFRRDPSAMVRGVGRLEDRMRNDAGLRKLAEQLRRDVRANDHKA
jgi:REP element-mobilizing transposase RayT